MTRFLILRELYLVDIFTKEKANLLVFDENSCIEEVMQHGPMLFVLTQNSKQEKAILNVYKIESLVSGFGTYFKTIRLYWQHE